MVSAVDEFLADVVPRQVDAQRALLEGDVEPWASIWSDRDPVTVFGAAVGVRSGREELLRLFGWLAARFSGPTDHRFEVVAAGVGGELAYVTGFEHKTVSVEGEPRTYTLRVTHVFRREDGEWRIVHRHGDRPPVDSAP